MTKKKLKELYRAFFKAEGLEFECNEFHLSYGTVIYYGLVYNIFTGYLLKKLITVSFSNTDNVSNFLINLALQVILSPYFDNIMLIMRIEQSKKNYLKLFSIALHDRSILYISVRIQKINKEA